MSRAAKTTFLATTAVCGLTLLGVHYLQRSERAQMHEGVIRDEERSRIKRERQDDFDLQAKLKEEFLKEQSVRETTREVEGGK